MEENTLWMAIVAFLFAASELLSFLPKVRANGVFQLVFGLLGKLMKKDSKPVGQ